MLKSIILYLLSLFLLFDLTFNTQVINGQKVSSKNKEKASAESVAQKKVCLESTAIILAISGIFTSFLTYDFQQRVNKAQSDYEALTPGETVGWNKARWDKEWNNVQSLGKTRDIFLYTSIAAFGSSLILLGIDLFILDKKDERAYLGENFSIMIASDVTISYHQRW